MLRFHRVLNTNTLKSFAASSNSSLRNVQKSKFLTISNKINYGKAVEHKAPSFGATRVLILGALSGSTAPMVFKKPVYCQAATIVQTDIAVTTSETAQDNNQLTTHKQRQPILHKGELSFGTFLGLCTGYFVRQVGKMFIGFVGATFVFLQYLSYKGFITVHWDRLEGEFTNTLDSDKDGKVTVRDLRTKWNVFIGLLTHHLQFKSAFLVGFYGGLRFG